MRSLRAARPQACGSEISRWCQRRPSRAAGGQRIAVYGLTSGPDFWAGSSPFRSRNSSSVQRRCRSSCLVGSPGGSIGAVVPSTSSHRALSRRRPATCGGGDLGMAPSTTGRPEEPCHQQATDSVDSVIHRQQRPTGGTMSHPFHRVGRVERITGVDWGVRAAGVRP